MRAALNAARARGASRDLLIVVLSGVVVLVAATAAAMLAPAAVPPGSGSTFSAGRYGTKAVYLTLARLGYQVERSYEPLADLVVESPSSTVVIVASPAEPMSAGDRRAAREFLERGGTLLATGTAAALLPELYALDVADPDNPFTERHVQRFEAHAGRGMREAPAILMAPEAVLVRQSPEYVLHYTAAGGAAAVASRRVGKGRAIWWTGSDPMLNAHAVGAGHMELLFDAIGDDPSHRVIWSEYYHGHRRSFWSYLAGTPVTALLAQMLAIGAVALFTYGRRRGAVRSLSSEPRTSVLEFVDALAALYRKAGAANGAVAVGLGRARRVLAAVAGLPASGPDAQIARGAAARLGLEPEAIAAALSEAESASLADVRPAAALRTLQRLQVLCARAQEHGAPRTQARF